MTVNNQTGGTSIAVLDKLRLRSGTASITANYTLTVNHPPLNFITPDAARDITLPAVADSDGLTFVIVNTAAGAYTLSVKNVGGTTIVSLAQNAIGIVTCNGVDWKGHSYVAPSGSVQTSDIANGAITTSLILDGAIVQSKLATQILDATVVKGIGGSNNAVGAIPVVHNVALPSGILSTHVTIRDAVTIIDAWAKGLSDLPASLVITINLDSTLVATIGTTSDAAPSGAGAVKRAVNIVPVTGTAGQVLKAIISGTTTNRGVGVQVQAVRGSITV